MKTTALIAGVLLIQGLWAGSTQGQVMSPRRLTQRIAPQTAQPAPPQASVPANPSSPPPAVVQPAPDPEQAQAAKDELARKTAEFRQKRAQEDAASTNSVSSEPLLIRCKPIQPDPNNVLQFLDLTLTNTTTKPITKATLRLVYCDANGQVLKEWTTYKQIDPKLQGQTSREIDEPAYFMPFTTRKVKIEVKDVRFADGTQWPPQG